MEENAYPDLTMEKKSEIGIKCSAMRNTVS